MGREGVGNNGGNLGVTPGGLREGEGAKLIELGGGSGVGSLGWKMLGQGCWTVGTELVFPRSSELRAPHIFSTCFIRTCKSKGFH